MSGNLAPESMAPVRPQSDSIKELQWTQLQRTVDGLIDAAVVVNRDLRPMVWNTAYMQVAGLRPRRFAKAVGEQGKRCRDLLSLEVCEKECLAKRCFDTGRSVRMDEIVGRSQYSGDESSNTLIVSATPLELGSGKIDAVLEIYRDVTAEVRIQSRYKVLLEGERHRAEILEDKVRERTAELESSLKELRDTRAQLIQSEKLASLGQLIAGIAHEINNPINFVYGNTEFLQRYVTSFLRVIDAYGQCELSAQDKAKLDQLKEEVDFAYAIGDVGNLLKSIKNGAERAAAIVRDLRTYVHGRAVEQSEVDLARCVNQVLNLINHQTKDQIAIEQQGGDGLPKVICNEGQLHQVFMNLLVNAVHAIGGKGTITIRYFEKDGGVAVSVSDTGTGIPEDELLKVFDPFFTTKPVGEGTGLGLSLSYTIVDGHHGTLSVQSEVGKGSTFTVWLPGKP